MHDVCKSDHQIDYCLSNLSWRKTRTQLTYYEYFCMKVRRNPPKFIKGSSVISSIFENWLGIAHFRYCRWLLTLTQQRNRPRQTQRGSNQVYVAGVQKFPQARYKNLIGTDCWSPKVINRRWPCAWQFFTISDVGANCCQNKSSATDRCIWWRAPRTRYVEVYTFTMNILVRWWPVAGIGLTRESLGAYERLDSTCDRSIKALKEWSMTLPRRSCCTPELFLSNFNRWRDQARGRCPEDKHSRHHKLTYSSI
jgi:hypothetical protein